jgi:hypothetical protein
MAFSYNPQTFATMDITDPKQANVFVQQLSRVLVEALSPQGIASLLNGSQLLSSTAVSSFSAVINPSISNVGPLNVNAAFSESVVINQTSLATNPVTLTLTNLVIGSVMFVRFINSSVGNLTFKIVASDTTGAAYQIFAVKVGGSSTDMTATGLVVNGASGLSAVFFGIAASGNQIELGVII